MGNGSIVLQDSPEDKNKIVLTLTNASTSEVMQFTIFPNILEVSMASWVFNVGGPITFGGTRHKDVSFVPGGDFQITGIHGPYGPQRGGRSIVIAEIYNKIMFNHLK